MSLSLNKLVMTVFVLAAFGFAIIIFKNNKPAQTIPYETPVLASNTPVNTNTSENFIQEAEARRDKALAEKEETELIAKRKFEKENSVECKFWKQQKNETSPPKVDEKITEFCTL